MIKDQPRSLAHQFYYSGFSLRDRAGTKPREEFQLALNQPTNGEAMIYAHVPLCEYICTFCPFDKTADKSQARTYLDNIKREIDLYANTPLVKSLNFTGVHIGGGTPTSLPNNYLGELIDYIKDKLGTGNAPLHVEGSVTTLDDQTIELLKEKNVTRTSFGVQSFNDNLRKRLGIGAKVEEVFSTVSRLKSAGLGVHIDLMYGFPDFGIPQQDEIAISDVEQAIELGVDSIEFSQFFPDGSPLERVIQRKGIKMPSKQKLVDILAKATSLLEAAGYEQVSEYAFHKKGRVMLETNYFGDSKDTLALGPKSIGRLNGFAYRNLPHTFYHTAIPPLVHLKKQSLQDQKEWDIISFPRMLKVKKSKVTKKFKDKFDQLMKEGLIEEEKDHFRLTKEGKLYISEIQLFLMNQ